ncbi:profilin [Aspergillus pseudodeflectus]|uniref:Profilin n=1 Tax=Aspergillus pseudodeflectus TaxID=176178 RepID=A0ABR4L4D3_9EURO
MSWQGYIDASLVGSGKIDKAIIAALEGDSIWAGSPNYNISPDELRIISEILLGSERDRDNAFAHGLYVAGERFVLARAEDRSIWACAGPKGVAIVKSKQAIIIGHYGETSVASNAYSTVEALADYLISVGY